MKISKKIILSAYCKKWEIAQKHAGSSTGFWIFLKFRKLSQKSVPDVRINVKKVWWAYLNLNDEIV